MENGETKVARQYLIDNDFVMNQHKAFIYENRTSGEHGVNLEDILHEYSCQQNKSLTEEVEKQAKVINDIKALVTHVPSILSTEFKIYKLIKQFETDSQTKNKRD